MNAGTKRKSMWPYGLIVYFVIFISWIANFIGIAVKNSSELVGADYYEQEIRYQERIDSIHRLNMAGGLGLSYDIGEGSLTVQLPADHVGKAIEGTLAFYRPDNAALDRAVKWLPNEHGQQSLSTAMLEPGNWKVEANWVLDGASYYAATNLLVAPSTIP